MRCRANKVSVIRSTCTARSVSCWLWRPGRCWPAPVSVQTQLALSGVAFAVTTTRSRTSTPQTKRDMNSFDVDRVYRPAITRSTALQVDHHARNEECLRQARSLLEEAYLTVTDPLNIRGRRSSSASSIIRRRCTRKRFGRIAWFHRCRSTSTSPQFGAGGRRVRGCARRAARRSDHVSNEALQQRGDDKYKTGQVRVVHAQPGTKPEGDEAGGFLSNQQRCRTDRRQPESSGRHQPYFRTTGSPLRSSSISDRQTSADRGRPGCRANRDETRARILSAYVTYKTGDRRPSSDSGQYDRHRPRRRRADPRGGRRRADLREGVRAFWTSMSHPGRGNGWTRSGPRSLCARRGDAVGRARLDTLAMRSIRRIDPGPRVRNRRLSGVRGGEPSSGVCSSIGRSRLPADASQARRDPRPEKAWSALDIGQRRGENRQTGRQRFGSTTPRLPAGRGGENASASAKYDGIGTEPPRRQTGGSPLATSGPFQTLADGAVADQTMFHAGRIDVVCSRDRARAHGGAIGPLPRLEASTASSRRGGTGVAPGEIVRGPRRWARCGSPPETRSTNSRRRRHHQGARDRARERTVSATRDRRRFTRRVEGRHDGPGKPHNASRVSQARAESARVRIKRFHPERAGAGQARRQTTAGPVAGTISVSRHAARYGCVPISIRPCAQITTKCIMPRRTSSRAVVYVLAHAPSTG